MVELELVGIHSDGEHLIVMAPDGERYRLVIDEALRAAVRRDRPHLEQVRADAVVRPKDIQAQIRAGASADDVAESSGIPVETVRRYEWPVRAEREHVSARAQALPLGRDADSPVLGDVVLDRLAARGVDTESISWDARRFGHSPWQVVAMFSSGERIREATWEVDLSARMVHALDDEARWLSETDWESTEEPRRHLQAVRSTPVYDVEADEEAAAAGLSDSLQELDEAISQGSREDSQESTAALVDELNAHRGVRPEAIDPEEEVHEPMLWEEPPAAHPPASHPEDVSESPEVLPSPEAGAGDGANTGSGDQESRKTAQEQPRRKSRRSRRTSVPSWDEIVFGAKND